MFDESLTIAESMTEAGKIKILVNRSKEYFIQTFILWIDMDNWYNLSALNHPTKRSDKAFPSEAAWR